MSLLLFDSFLWLASDRLGSTVVGNVSSFDEPLQMVSTFTLFICSARHTGLILFCIFEFSAFLI